MRLVDPDAIFPHAQVTKIHEWSWGRDELETPTVLSAGNVDVNINSDANVNRNANINHPTNTTSSTTNADADSSASFFSPLLLQDEDSLASLFDSLQNGVDSSAFLLPDTPPPEVSSRAQSNVTTPDVEWRGSPAVEAEAESKAVSDLATVEDTPFDWTTSVDTP